MSEPTNETFTPAVKAPPKSMMKWIIGAAAALSAFLIGLYLGGLMAGGTGENSADYQAGYDAAKAKMAGLGLVPGLAQEPAPLMSISGTIAEVSGDSIRLEAAIPPAGPLDEERQVTLTVRTDANTKITIRKMLPPPTPEENEAARQRYDEAQQRYMQAIMTGQEGVAAPEPPKTYESEQGSMEDLKTGLRVSITTSEDMRTNSTVTATEIVVSK